MDSLWCYEQLSSQQIETDTNKLNLWGYTSDSIPFFQRFTYKCSFINLNEQTPFDLIYNEAVKTQINIYANNYRNHVSKCWVKLIFTFLCLKLS